MISRRRFLQSSASLALLPLLPRVAMSATLRTRPSWDTFCAGPSFQAFLNGVAAMKANKDYTSPASWGYWVNVHKSSCPHGKPYFLAWHRGLLYRFEGWLRKASGDSTMVIPYWDYYTTPQVPPAFLDPTSPLYRSDRTGTDVSGALSLDPFADTVVNFQRGLTDAFEPAIESHPHNPVHNLIGGAMSYVSISPRDPLFWVHHANIDRLWAAWLTAGNGRQEPASTDAYWSGSFAYGAAIKSVPRLWTINTTRYLYYQYEDETMPSSLPSSGYSSATAPLAATTLASSSSLATAVPTRPPSVRTTSLGAPAGPLVLDEHSISVDIALSAQDANRVRSLMLQPAATTASTSSDPLRVVLDGVNLSALGEKGGYFYKVFINLPEQPGVTLPERAYLLGMLGSFEISVAKMQAAMGGATMQGMATPTAHGQSTVRFAFPISEALRRSWPTQLDKLCISFVRVDGRPHPAKGGVIRIESFQVEADSTT